MKNVILLLALSVSTSVFAGETGNKATKPLFKDDKELLETLSRAKNHPWGTEIGDKVFERGIAIVESDKLKFCSFISGGEGFSFEPQLISEGKIIKRGLGAGIRNQFCVSGLKGGEDTKYYFIYDLDVRLELISENGQRMTENQKAEKVVSATLQASASESNELEYGTNDDDSITKRQASEKQTAFLNKLSESAKAANPYYRFAKYYNSIRRELRAHGYELCSKRMSRFKTGNDLNKLAKLEVFGKEVRQGQDVKVSKEICFVDPATKQTRRLEVATRTSMSIDITENY